MEARLDGRNALITGGSAGIGKAIAKSFLTSGANVSIVARRSEVLTAAKAEIEAQGAVTGTSGKVIALSADIRNSEECEKVIAKTQAAFGHVDILVNNAGTSQRGDFLEVSDEIWQDDLDLKLFSAVRLCRLVIPGMRSRKWGRIINVGSVVARLGNPGQANYVSSKAGLEGFTRSLALEVGSRGITVNLLAPGFIETDMTAALSDEQTAAMLARIPLGRMGEAKEVAAAVSFLSGDQAAYITGQTIHINGGMFLN